MRDELDLVPILESLALQEVDFVLIGGLAAAAHGTSRPTFDVDITYARDPENLERLAKALRQTETTSLHLIDDPLGAPSFHELRAHALAMSIRGFSVHVASLDHLIAMKEAEGRPHDRLTAWELRAISDELRAG